MESSFQALEKAAELHGRVRHPKFPDREHKYFFDAAIQPAGNLAAQRLFRSGALRAKLAISQPGDPYEQEADRVADHVMGMPEPGLQRTCAACETGATPCPKCEAEKKAQRKPEASANPIRTSVPDSFVQSLGSGQQLDPATRSFFEPRLGADLTHIRVHTDSRATESARSIHAKAYTIGQHVILGPGQDQLTTSQGKRLLAHELAHVFQQGSAIRASEAADERSNGTISADAKGLPITALPSDGHQLQLQQLETGVGSQPYGPAPVPPVMPPSLPPPQTGPPVYICWSPTEAGPPGSTKNG